jgi:hypothetical protein
MAQSQLYLGKLESFYGTYKRVVRHLRATAENKTTIKQ